MRVIKGCDLANLHTQVVPYIRKNCYRDAHNVPIKFKGENGQDTIEAPPVTLICDTPAYGDRFIKNQKILPFTQKFMEEYAYNLVHGSKSKFEYDYNERLRHYGHPGIHEAVDQIYYMISKLRESPNSRRAQAITWKPWHDTTREDVPCLQLVHGTIRNGKFNMEVVFRSEDMHLGLGPNMYGLTSLQIYLANCLHVDVGTYTHIALCPHLYWWRDFDYLVGMV